MIIELQQKEVDELHNLLNYYQNLNFRIDKGEDIDPNVGNELMEDLYNMLQTLSSKIEGE
jgi:hypothetical protein